MSKLPEMPHASESLEDRALDEPSVTVTFPALYLRNKEAARALGMALDLFLRCARHYKFEPDVQEHRITLWCPDKLRLLKNAISKGGLPPPKKKASSPVV